jgi:hypothetical protein
MAALARPGVWNIGAWSGAILGLSMTEALASLPGDADADLARRLFVVAEAAFVSAAARRAESGRE